jgi:glycosyltransferase involved in cell wall biosynthesis
MKTVRVAAVVPVFNEENRIGRVLSVLEGCDILDEIIVVNDGSTDATLSQIPNENGIRPVSLERNLGKGGALAAGLAATTAEILVFVDADLVGLKEYHIGELVRPVLHGEADMCVGIFQGGRWWTDLWQKVAPYISGQRALRREVFASAPGLEYARFGVELALTRHAHRLGHRVEWVTLHGLTHVMKEEKMGVFPGVRARVRMYLEMGKSLAVSLWLPFARGRGNGY